MTTSDNESLPRTMPLEERGDWITEHAPRIAAALRHTSLEEVEANDVHIRVGEHPWVQVGGTLVPFQELAIPSEEEIWNTIRWIGGRELSKTVVYPVETAQRWRTQTMECLSGPAVTFRRLNAELPSFDLLGDNLAGAREVVTLGEGLVVVCGATGSGKTTTLAAILSLINTNRSCHIYTIENPIEFVYPQGRSIFTQRETDLHVDTAANAFNSALRAAPDVILLGELRTEDEADLCLEAALSGHLVLATMHARDIGTVCERIIGNKGEAGASKLAQAFQMSISQRLIPRADNPRKRQAFAEIVPRDSAIVNYIRRGEMASIAGHVANTLQGGLDGQLAKGVAQGIINRSAARTASIDEDEFNRRYDATRGLGADASDDEWD